MRGLRLLLLTLAALAGLSAGARRAAAQIPTTPSVVLEGPYDYVSVGASLRTQPNTGNGCAVGTSVSLTVSIPSGSTVQGAYLYWGGSGPTDASVRWNGSNISADRTANAVWNTYFTYFGAFKNVTSLVGATGGTYTISNIAVGTGIPWCNDESDAVAGGAALIVVYRNDALPLRRIQIRDGLYAQRYESLSTTLTGFLGAPSPKGKITVLTYEGDPELVAGGGTDEEVTFNGATVSASNTNAFVGGRGHGFDLLTYDVSAHLAAGARSATFGVSTNDDLVITQALVSSIDISIVDVTPKGLASPVQRAGGGTARYSQSFTVENASILAQRFDLLARATGAPSPFITIDSVRSGGVTFSLARGDSARTPSLAAGTSATYQVWYRVAAGTSGDNVEWLKARSVTYPTRAEGQSEGWQEIRRVVPQLALAKSVTPNTNIRPGVDLTYAITPSNTGVLDVNSVVVADEVPPQTQFKLASVTQTLPAGVTAAVAYSNDGGATYAYTPVSGGCGAPAGYDACVNRVRWTLTGTVPAGNVATTLRYLARVK